MMRSHSSLHLLIATGVLDNYIVWVGCGLAAFNSFYIITQYSRRNKQM